MADPFEINLVGSILHALTTPTIDNPHSPIDSSSSSSTHSPHLGDNPDLSSNSGTPSHRSTPSRTPTRQAKRAAAALALPSSVPIYPKIEVNWPDYEWEWKSEDAGTLLFKAVWNDGSPQNLIWLNSIKNIFGRQLPKMPKTYITRLVFDTKHRTIVLLRNSVPMGGVCFRSFGDRNFVEIAFLAITSEFQIRGMGTMVLNNLKTYMQREGINHFLTFADNFAIPFFQKQGFTIRITLNKEMWVGWIKDYEGGTLMECRVSKDIDFLHVKETISQQRKCIFDKIKQVSNSHIVYPGLRIFQSHPYGTISTDFRQIPGVRDSLLKMKELAPHYSIDLAPLHRELKSILNQIVNHPESWPFLTPVDVSSVPDYANIITDPIDLSTIEKRLDNGTYYRTKYIFCADLIRMCENCRTYNRRDTAYYQCAAAIEAFLREQPFFRDCFAELKLIN